MTTPTSRSALILIDIQQSFEKMPFWSENDLPGFRRAVLELEAGCRAHGAPVVHIFHVGAAGPFAEASGYVRPLQWLESAPDVVFHKHTHNAFSDTGLDLWLRRRDINHLIIAGIRTEQCCETTTRVGADMGYTVDFVTEATLTFPMTHAGSARTYTADEIKAHTELVLAGRFARICKVDEVFGAISA